MKAKRIRTPYHFLCEEIFDYKLSGLFGRENGHYFRGLVDRESLYWDCACSFHVGASLETTGENIWHCMLPLSFDAYITLWWCGGFWWHFCNGWVTGFSWNVVANKALFLRLVWIDWRSHTMIGIKLNASSKYIHVFGVWYLQLNFWIWRLFQSLFLSQRCSFSCIGLKLTFLSSSRSHSNLVWSSLFLRGS